MGTGAFRCLGEEGIINGVAEDASPDVLQIIERVVELGRGQSATFAHPDQSCGRLDMGDPDGANPVRLVVGAAGLFRSRLIDQELDQGAGIEVEAQRRPSETYSAAFLP